MWLPTDHCLLIALQEGMQSLMLTQSKVSQRVQWDQRRCGSTVTIILWSLLLFLAVAPSYGAESFLCLFVFLSFLPSLPLFHCICLCMYANNQPWGYPTACILWVVFKGLLPGDSNSSTALRWALNSHKSIAHSFPAARLIAVPYIVKWAYTESQGLFGKLTQGTKVSLSLPCTLIISSPCFCFLQLYCFLSLFQSK